MMVICGLDPKLPPFLAGQLPVAAVGVDQYVKDLVQYFAETYKEVREKGKELARMTEGTQTQGPGAPLAVGDLVLRLKPEGSKPKGITRFQERTESHIHKVSHKVGEATFELETLGGEQILGPDGKPVRLDSSSLIKLDMPELEFDLSEYQQRRLEIRDTRDFTIWKRGTLEKVLPDATVMVRFDHDSHRTHVLDLTQHCYRWIYEEESGDATPRS